VRPPFGADTPWRLEPELMGALLLGRLELAASVGAAWPARRTIPMTAGAGALTLLAFPARIAAGWVLPIADDLSVVPTVATGFDLIMAETRGIGLTRRSSALEPIIEAGGALRARLTRHIWIDVQAFQGLDLRPEEFYVTDPMTQRSLTLLVTPRIYTRVRLNFGVFF
jgi:hypothetical protein